MRPAEILTCLGAPADDARVQALLRQFSITRQPEMEEDELSDEPGAPQDWLPNLSRGIEFGFEDEASFLGAPPVEWGSGPMLLTEVYFYSALPGTSPYEAEFPFGLTHGDDRATVRARMQHSRAPLRSRQRDTWAFKDFDFTVDYAGRSGAFAYAVAIQRPSVPPVNPDVLARCPSVADFVSVLGRSVSDDLLDTTLARTGYARAFQAVDPTAALSDLRDEMGLELQFGPVPGVAGLALDRIALLGDRRFGSRVWAGELPQGLRFGASWQEIVAAAGQNPEEISEDDFYLTAFWRSGAVVIEVEYSTMTNALLAVSLIYSPLGG